jgi:predicted PurR-regulated permease PerM
MNHNSDDAFRIVVLVVFALIILHYFWPIVVGFLAACGLYFLIQQYQKNERNRRR